jgi:hypothetical protein
MNAHPARGVDRDVPVDGIAETTPGDIERGPGIIGDGGVHDVHDISAIRQNRS